MMHFSFLICTLDNRAWLFTPRAHREKKKKKLERASSVRHKCVLFSDRGATSWTPARVSKPSSGGLPVRRTHTHIHTASWSSWPFSSKTHPHAGNIDEREKIKRDGSKSTGGSSRRGAANTYIILLRLRGKGAFRQLRARKPASSSRRIQTSSSLSSPSFSQVVRAQKASDVSRRRTGQSKRERTF